MYNDSRSNRPQSRVDCRSVVDVCHNGRDTHRLKEIAAFGPSGQTKNIVTFAGQQFTQNTPDRAGRAGNKYPTLNGVHLGGALLSLQHDVGGLFAWHKLDAAIAEGSQVDAFK